MTREEFDKKWGDIRTTHDEDCNAFDFDFAKCTCGLDDLWAQRNADLSSVADDRTQTEEP